MSKKQTEQQTAAAAATNESTEYKALIGSSVQPATFEFSAGVQTDLGTVVSGAFDKSGLSIDDWNAQPEESREAAVAAEVEALKAAAETTDAAAADITASVAGLSAELVKKATVAKKTKAAPAAETVALKLTAAVAIDGNLEVAGTVVHVSETDAKNLLHRGKAIIATAE